MDNARKIYYNNKPLMLVSDVDTYLSGHDSSENYGQFFGASAASFSEAFRHLDISGTAGAIVEGNSIEALMRQLEKLYKPIDAGGGVVTNEDNAALMIYRRGKWDLPKGKRDKGEDIADCALREVSEETGLQQLKLGEKICDTYHLYHQFNKNQLKRTAWYRMQGTINEKLLPQAEENILEARWVHEKDMGPIVEKTYEAIREVLHMAGFKW